MLHYIDFGEYLDEERFGSLPVRGRNFCINNMELMPLTAHGASNETDCSWRSLRQLELKTLMDLPFACDPGAMEYAQKQDNLY